VDTTSSRSPQKRCVIPLHPTPTYDSRKIKPLTEEEKNQKLVELREKMSEKRAKKAAEEAKEAKANELIRRKAGKVRTKTTLLLPRRRQANQKKKKRASLIIAQESAQIKEDLKNKQILKDIEAKRRGTCRAPRTHPTSLFFLKNDTMIMCHTIIFAEKEDEKRARAAIKAQIEADKRERAQKAAQEKALREGNPADPAASAAATTSSSAPATAVPVATTPSTSVPGREFKDTRLQIRLASGGQPLTTTLPSDSSCVPLFI
jgi:hypothetical protein